MYGHCDENNARRILSRDSTLLRWDRVFLEQTRILSVIHFTIHFIEIFVVETKRFVGSSVNVILTRQTCGQCSSRAAESKRRALGNYFYERIRYVFLTSKCKRDRDLRLCTTSVLAFGEPQHNGKIRFFLRRNTFFFSWAQDDDAQIGSRVYYFDQIETRSRSRFSLYFQF